MSTWLRGGRKVKVQRLLVSVSSHYPSHPSLESAIYNIAVFDASIVLFCLNKKLKRKENKVTKHNTIKIIIHLSCTINAGCPRISGSRRWDQIQDATSMCQVQYIWFTRLWWYVLHIATCNLLRFDSNPSDRCDKYVETAVQLKF